ncbi:elongation factor P [Candidatus Uhrbacteria bacterium RIFCSPLOWO2_01_FULL_47_24]|uniref:Elongation factor P n=1 Tax=Candidatus Uhrbacteria bacterium RIFCSPLOWO2_01_FULL_47_24 TaxID=1802401 RepID=A0A1F7UUT3_9BACT|nr:MAG: elongation factor P [Candidatus Uhrbacteria bacterium RIFCSPHIGHO2_01_FULL_47_11]OGL69133.1 MAG: elongation factor P [Candidatus Uhrbacteria bacterium RIFCSPHIGHO2_02_FULL_46_47]OGL74796.1 MAG: elongation factor P [Candidatus Uhrbacteria bacterium RIFCSPHIGHO2_12_FULL_47_11]OGL81504.1 MAG: elongation factor P [Candidatus Uhrbacteria bacterium RIFCSPLOWO2_01_FULL_47_24]OGL83749.1 MAG: elongation factor P [Candidatus Uhrbacteria bacterium RIFCSPLOWO2_02_FULL_46_25]OGL93618.1 MAG: elongat
MSKANEISRGLIINYKNEPHLVVDFQHVNPGKGSAFVRSKLKALKTGKVVENTFKSDEAVEFVEMERKKVQYLYGTPAEHTFMDMKTYEQFSIGPDVVGEAAKFLKEGVEVTLLVDESGTPITVDFPKKVTLKVTEAPPAVKGDTSGNVTKEIVLENGLKVRAPMFIKEGDLVIINTDTGEYVERST